MKPKDADATIEFLKRLEDPENQIKIGQKMANRIRNRMRQSALEQGYFNGSPLFHPKPFPMPELDEEWKQSVKGLFDGGEKEGTE